jgi:hypothetical protein
MTNPRATHGHPLGVKPHPILRRDQLRKEGLVVETSAQSINRKLGSYG